MRAWGAGIAAVAVVAGVVSVAGATTAGATIGSYDQAVLLGLPTAFYTFEDASPSGPFADATQHGYQATSVGGAGTVAGSPFGATDRALQVNGDASYATLPALAPLTGDSARTVEFWFETSVSQPQCLFTAGTQAHLSSFSICLTDGNQYASPSPGSPGIYLQTYDADIYVPAPGLANGSWHYLAVTLSGPDVGVSVDGGTPSGYLWNGTGYSGPLTQPITLPAPLNTTAGPSNIGGPGWQSGLSGLIDEVAIYPAALDPATLNAHFQAAGAAPPGTQAWVWGDGSSGQIGNLTSGSTTPSAVTMPGVGFTQISDGTGSNLALDGNGLAWAWGDDSAGQLGTGTTGGTAGTPTAVAMPSGDRFKQVSAGPFFDLAVDDAGQAWAWGTNGSGQLGNGSVAGSSTPVAVEMPSGVRFTSVTAGAGFGLGLDTTGQAWAWGDDSYQQFGNNQPTMTYSLTPVAVAMPAGVTFSALSTAPFDGVSEPSVLALDSTGRLWAWGFNDGGQLGLGSRGGSHDVPALVASASGVTFRSVAAGFGFSAAVDTTGALWEWGTNASVGINSATPVLVPSAPAGVAFATVAAGGDFALALDQSGDAWGWGDATLGQLGDGATSPSTTPVAVSMPPGVTFTDLSAGWSDGVALGGPIVGVPSIQTTLVGPGSGTVTSTPAGIDCPGTCTAPFAAGSNVTLHASPTADGRSFFSSWQFDCISQPTPEDCVVTVPAGLLEVAVLFGQATATATATLDHNYVDNALERVGFDACSSSLPSGASSYTWQVGAQAPVTTSVCDGLAPGGYSALLAPGDYPVSLYVADAAGTVSNSTTVTLHVRPFVSFLWQEEQASDPQATSVPVDFNACWSGGVTSYRWDTNAGTTTTTSCKTTISLPVESSEVVGLVGTDQSGQYSAEVDQTIGVTVSPAPCNTWAVGADACWRQGLSWIGDALQGPTRNPDYVVTTEAVGEEVTGQIGVAITCDGNSYSTVSVGVGIGPSLPVGLVLAWGYIGDPRGPEPTLAEIDNYVQNETSSITVGAGGGINYTQSNDPGGPAQGVEYWVGTSITLGFSADLFGSAPSTNITPPPQALCANGVTFSTAWQLANNHAITPNTANAPVVGLTSGQTPVVDGGFYVSAGGFLPGSDVTITLHSTPTVLAVTPADWQGNIGLPLQLPPGLPPGRHTVVATGIGPDGAPLTESSTIDVVSDLTPPEAVIVFDPATHGLEVYGQDTGGSGVSPGPVTPVIQPDPGPGRPHRQLDRYRITDGAGNTLDLVLSVQTSGGHLAASVISTAYNGGAPIPAPTNSLSFSWPQSGTEAGDALMEDVAVSATPTSYHVLARYSPFSGDTQVADLVRNLSGTVAGELLVQAVTQAGGLVVDTPGFP